MTPNDGVPRLPVEGQVVLALLPGSHAGGAEHHGGGSAAAEVLLQGVGPGPPRHQLPAVEEDGQVAGP